MKHILLPMATKRHQTKPNFKSSVIFVIKKKFIKNVSLCHVLTNHIYIKCGKFNYKKKCLK